MIKMESHDLKMINEIWWFTSNTYPRDNLENCGFDEEKLTRISSWIFLETLFENFERW